MTRIRMLHFDSALLRDVNARFALRETQLRIPLNGDRSCATQRAFRSRFTRLDLGPELGACDRRRTLARGSNAKMRTPKNSRKIRR